MPTGKALMYAAGITIISAILLTWTCGIPTTSQFLSGSGVMFLLAFVVLKFAGGAHS